MTARHRIQLAALLFCAACTLAALECRGEARKPLSIKPSAVVAGERLYFDVSLQAPVSAPFDVYCFALTTYGVFSLTFDGHVSYGLRPSYEYIWGREYPFAARVRPNAVIPLDMRYNYIRFYLFLSRAGEWIPFDSFDDLGPYTANIIYFDSATLLIR